MTFKQFLAKQLIAVIQWDETADGILAYRFPMRDMEIQNGAQLTVRESQVAIFVNEGRIADVFQPGMYTLNTRTLPVLTDLNNWDKGFQSPFKSDVFFFTTRLQLDQKWGTGTPMLVRDKEFGAVYLRCYGVYTYHISDPRTFFRRISGALGTYHISDLEGQLRALIVARMTEIFASSGFSVLDMAANQGALGAKIIDQMKPVFSLLGLELDQFVVQNVSLPEDLQDILNQRIGMNMIGDMGRYTQYAAAESMPMAASNPGSGANIGVGLGAGAAVGQAMLGSLKAASTATFSAAPVTAPAAEPAVRFCIKCQKSIPLDARFCPTCGQEQ